MERKFISEQRPIVIKQLPRGYSVRYDVREIEVDGEDGRRKAAFEYKEVLIRRIDPDTIANTIVAARYGDKELGLIVDRVDSGLSSKEWDEYSAYRSDCKRYADEITSRSGADSKG